MKDKYEKAYNEIVSLLKYGESEWKINGENEQLFIPETLEALEMAKMCLGSIQQIQWERDVAIKQLNELGYEFGEKIKTNEI